MKEKIEEEEMRSDLVEGGKGCERKKKGQKIERREERGISDLKGCWTARQKRKERVKKKWKEELYSGCDLERGHKGKMVFVVI